MTADVLGVEVLKLLGRCGDLEDFLAYRLTEISADFFGRVISWESVVPASCHPPDNMPD